MIHFKTRYLKYIIAFILPAILNAAEVESPVRSTSAESTPSMAEEGEASAVIYIFPESYPVSESTTPVRCRFLGGGTPSGNLTPLEQQPREGDLCPVHLPPFFVLSPRSCEKPSSPTYATMWLKLKNGKFVSVDELDQVQCSGSSSPVIGTLSRLHSVGDLSPEEENLLSLALTTVRSGLVSSNSPSVLSSLALLTNNNSTRSSPIFEGENPLSFDREAVRAESYSVISSLVLRSNYQSLVSSPVPEAKN